MYAARPEGTLVISPDNQPRMELNRGIHGELQDRRSVSGEEHSVNVLIPRPDMTGADRAWAAQYEAGDVVRCTQGSKAIGISPRRIRQGRELR